MRFLLDNNLAPRLAASLDALTCDHEVVHLKGHFGRGDIPDEEWIETLADDDDWVVISGDTRIFKSPHLRTAWEQAKLTTFFLAKGWMNQPFWRQAWWLVRWWPRIIEQSTLVERGSGFGVPAKPTGKFRPLISS